MIFMTAGGLFGLIAAIVVIVFMVLAFIVSRIKKMSIRQDYGCLW